MHKLHIQTLTPRRPPNKKQNAANPRSLHPKCLWHRVEEVQGQLPLPAFLASADGGAVASAALPTASFKEFEFRLL